MKEQNEVFYHHIYMNFKNFRRLYMKTWTVKKNGDKPSTVKLW